MGGEGGRISSPRPTHVAVAPAHVVIPDAELAPPLAPVPEPLPIRPGAPDLPFDLRQRFGLQ